MLDVWRARRAFPGLSKWWRRFEMTDLQCALNFLYYLLCQRRFHRQLPSCEFISSCWLLREHTQLLTYKTLSFAASVPSLCFLQPSAVAAMGSASQALTTSKKSCIVKQQSLHKISLLHTHINRNKK